MIFTVSPLALLPVLNTVLLGVILAKVARGSKRERKMGMKVQDILDKVTAEQTVVDSAAALLASLKQEIDAAGTDPAKLQAISDALDAQGAELANAVAVNTPAAQPG